MAKFNQKAVLLYGVAQIAENTPVIRGCMKTGTISVSQGSTTVTGVGTAFTTELVVGDILYNDLSEVIGVVTSIATTTSLSITPAKLGVAGVAFYTEKNRTTGTISTSTTSTTVTGVGTSFLTELTPLAYIYDVLGNTVGQVASVTNDTTAVLVGNGLIALTGAGYSVGLGEKNVLVGLNLNYSTERTTEAFQYTGDELSRDEETIVTDTFAKFDFETFVPKMGAIAGNDPTPSEVPLSAFMQSAGTGIELSTTNVAGSGFIRYTNSLRSNEFLTVEIRRSSLDIPTEKIYTLEDCRGSVDLTGVVGTKGKLKFSYQGNLLSISQKKKLVADFGQQKALVAGSLNSRTVTNSELVLYTSGTEPALTGVKNFCFAKFSATNFTGFDFARYQTSCGDGWDTQAMTSDVDVTIIEDSAGAIYNPDNQVTQNHVLDIKYGSGAGNKVQLTFHKLQLVGITGSTVASYVGQDLKFRNRDTVDLILS